MDCIAKLACMQLACHSSSFRFRGNHKDLANSATRNQVNAESALNYVRETAQLLLSWDRETANIDRNHATFGHLLAAWFLAGDRETGKTCSLDSRYHTFILLLFE